MNKRPDFAPIDYDPEERYPADDHDYQSRDKYVTALVIFIACCMGAGFALWVLN